MQRNYTIGTLTRDQLSRLIEILAPYRSEPLTAPVMFLAVQLARQEVSA